MSDAFLLPLSNIQVARFFTKAPGPKSRFFRFFSKNSFWRLNCYINSLFTVYAFLNKIKLMLWWQIFIIVSLVLVVATAVLVVMIARSERGSP